MTTVARIIALALKDAGVTGEGETASAETLLDAFDTLKMMVAQWQVEDLMIYAQTTINFAATGAQSYTIGATGAVVADRPSEVIGAFWRSGLTDYPLDVVGDFNEYQSISYKTLNSIPELVCYDATYANGTLYVWPQPSTGSFYITVSAPLPTYAAVTDDLAVPAEYELLVRYSLAEMLPSVFQVPARPDIAGLAARARKTVKRNNSRVPTLQMPSSLASKGRFLITTGR